MLNEMKEGVYINKNGEDIVEIVFKYLDTNDPFFLSDFFHPATQRFGIDDKIKYLEDNYLFCCEF
jgi:hypothetical protein